MNRDEKTAVVAEIAGQIGAAEAIFAVDYRGISVSQVAVLRDRLREADARFRIVKNSLTERAADQAGVADLKPLLIGPTALAIVQGDPALAAKALYETARALHLLDFKGGLLNGDVLTGDDVRSIARLPSRDVLRAQLVGTIAAPISGLVRGLNALIAGLAIQLQAMVDQGLVTGTAPAPAPVDAPSPAAAEPAPIADAPAAEPVADAEPAAVAPAEPEAVADAPVQPEPEAVADAPVQPEPEAVADAPVEPEPQSSAQESASDAERPANKEEA